MNILDQSTNNKVMLLPEIGIQLILSGENIPTKALFLPTVSELKTTGKPVVENKLKNITNFCVLYDIQKASLRERFETLKIKFSDFSDSPTFLNHLAILADATGNHEDAVKYFKEADNSYNGNIFKHKIGDLLIRKGDFELARTTFEKQDLNTDEIANLRLAYISIVKSDYIDAWMYVTKSLEINKLGFRTNWLAGILSLVNKNYKSAIRHFRVAIEQKPTSSALYYNIAIAHVLLNQKNNAIKELKKALYLDPYNEAALLRLADILEIYDESLPWLIGLLERYLNSFPDSLNISNSLAKLYYDAEDYKSAIKVLENSVRVNESTILWGNLGLCYWRTLNYNKAIKNISYAINLCSKDTEINREIFFNDIGAQQALVNLSNLFIEIREDNKLIEVVEPFIANCVDDRFYNDKIMSKVFSNYIIAKYRTGNKEDIVEELLSIINSKRIEPFLYGNLCILITYHFGHRSENVDIAIEYGKKALRELPSDINKDNPIRIMLLNNLAVSYIENNNLTDAKIYVSKIYEILTHNYSIPLATTALYDLRKGRIDKGRRKYLSAIELTKDNILKKRMIKKYNIELGRALLGIGDVENAALHLRRAKNIKVEDDRFSSELNILLNYL